MSASTGSPLRILILEHDESDAELCTHELRRSGFDVQADLVGTAEQFRKAIGGNTYDIVLADFRLPDWTGMDAFRELRARNLDTPLILVTGTLGDERAVECVKEGVADYIIKNNIGRLSMAVRRALQEKRTRDERARSEELIRRLTLAVDQSPASVIITDTHGTIEYVNQRFVQDTGFAQEEAVGQNPRILRSGLTPKEVYASMWKAVRAGHVWHGEIENRRKNGELFWSDVTISPITTPEGGITHFLGMQQDITDRRLAEQTIRDREERFRLLLEASFDAIDITQDGIILEVNRGFEKMFGYTQEEVIGRPVLDFAAEESVNAIRERIEQGIEGTYDLIGKRKDGKKIILEATDKTLTINGQPARMAALRDVTERRALEDQFRQAQKMEAVGRLAGGVAHDFNNLLMVITSYADMVVDDLGPNDPRRQDLQEIQKAAARAAGLTRQLLAFSRQQVIEPRLVTIEQVVANAEKMLKRIIGEDVRLESSLNHQPSTVMIDPNQLEQVIMNLAVNARDAMPAGGQLTIETSVVDIDLAYARTHWPAEPGRFAMLAVSDTGTGMSAETKARIFEPFFTTKEAGKGTGLGLATVYGIVKQSGGFLFVYSEPDQGTSFKIYLPLAEAADAAADVAPPAQPRRSHGEVILLAEDDTAVRTAARTVLERFGYTVVEAASGKAALAIAAQRSGRIDLLLTDVVMPEMNGRDLARKFSELRPDAKVIYMSGYTDDAVLRHGVLHAGINYLQKPFSPAALAQIVRDVLDSEPRVPSPQGP